MKDQSRSTSVRLAKLDWLRSDVLVVTFVMHVLGLALPLALLQIYDRILPAQAYGTATFLVLGVGIAIIFEAILRYGRHVIFANMAARVELKTATQIFDRFAAVDINQIERRGPAKITDALRAVAQVRDFWSGQAGVALYEIPFVIVYLALIAYIGGWLALIPLGLFGLAILLAIVLNPRLARASSELDQSEHLRHDFSWASFAALPYLKAIGAEGMVGAIWRRISARYLNAGSQVEVHMGWVRENAATIGQLSTILVVAFGALEVISGAMTTGALAACSILAGRSIGPAMASLGYWAQLTRVQEAQAKIDDLLALPDNPALASVSEAQSALVSHGQLSVVAPFIGAESIQIQPGEIVHIVARDTVLSSRLLTAISGMSDDNEIKVAVDGHDLAQFKRDEYRASVMLLSKQTALIPGSILNNITLYDARYHQDIEQYVSALGMKPYLDKLRYGILTDVGGAGVAALSEGMIQRIALIRALVRQPKILLIDHGASAIDLDGIKRLADLLRSLRGQITILIATNQPALIAACSRSLQLGADKGVS